MKRTSFLLILTTCLCLLASSCRKASDTDSVFAEAESLMNVQPDSALALLKAIPTPEKLTGEAQARYALLYSQALDKNYIDTANDSLIQIAVDYYKDRNDAKAKFSSYYYLGCIYANGKQYEKACLAFINAEQEVEALGDDYVTGMLYQQMTYIYREYYDQPKALEYIQKAILCYERAGKQQHKLFAQLVESAVYGGMGQRQKCIDRLCEIMEEAKQIEYIQLVRFCLGDLIIMNLKMERQEDAMKYYKELADNYSMEGFTPSFYANLGLLQVRAKNDTSALAFLKKAWELSDSRNDSIFVHGRASEIYHALQNYKQAYSELENSVILQNKDMLKALRQPVLTIQKDFLEAELTHKKYRIKMERLVYTLAGIILFLVAVLAISVLRKKLKKQEKAYQQKLADLQAEALEREQQLRTYTQELESKSDFSRQDIERLTQELAISKEHIEKSRLFREEARLHEQELRTGFQTLLNKLLKRSSKQLEETLYVLQKQYRNDERKLKAIDEYVCSIQSNFYGNRKASKHLEELVNEYYNRAMERLRTEVKLPDEKHYQLVCLLLAGLSVNFIASLTGETTNAIYKRREKIRELIKQSDALSRDLDSWI